MAELTFKLKDGIPLEGKPNQVDVVLRMATADETLECKARSERIIETDKGVHLVVSPSLLTREMLMVQIVKVGDIPGNPLKHELFKKLSSADLVILDEHVQKMDKVLAKALKEVEQRGRTDSKG